MYENPEKNRQDLFLLNQKSLKLYAKVELLNRDFVPVDEMQGEVLDGDISVTSDSDIRRTANLRLILSADSLAGENTQVWMRNRVKIYLGIENNLTGDIVWYSQGLFAFADISYAVSSQDRTVSIQALDMMSMLNGDLNGQIGAQSIVIESAAENTAQGNDIRSAIIAVLTQYGNIASEYGMNMTAYNIETVASDAGDNIIPYDLEFSAGVTVYEMLCALRDIYPNWEMYFDEEGVFVCRRVTSSESDPSILESDSLTPLVISENTSLSFRDVYNVTEFWGACLESDYYSEDVVLTDGCYRVDIEALETLMDNLLVGIKTDAANPASASVSVNELTAYPITDGDGNALSAGRMLAGKTYVLRYRAQEPLRFEFLGENQIHAIVKECSAEPTQAFREADAAREGTANILYTVNPQSPFTIEKIGEIKNAISVEEYDNIYSDELCFERAKYQNWQTTRLCDTITIETIIIPWLTVNQKVEYRSAASGETNAYIITSIQKNLSGGTMNLTMRRFFPLYPY